MNFAPVMPPELYPLFDHGTYHMVQAPLLMTSENACGWFRGLGDEHTTILDNGVIETGIADWHALESAAKVIKPDIVICPDAFNDADKTIHLCIRFYKHCRPLATKGVMLVPHGANVTDWVMCALQMLVSIRPWRSRFSDLHVGIPKVLDTMEGGRLLAIRKLLAVTPLKLEQLHLLGIWNNVQEALDILAEFPVAGVDSTFPVAYGLRGQRLQPLSPKWMLMVEDWEYCPESELIQTMVNCPDMDHVSRNIKAVNEWIQRLHTPSATSAPSPKANA